MESIESNIIKLRIEEIQKDHMDYLQKHQEYKEVLNDFLSTLLLYKPVLTFIREIFTYLQDISSSRLRKLHSSTSRLL